MISLKDVLEIHEILIEEFGGAKGIRDQGILESAINRPYQTFNGQDLYPTPAEKSAAIFESIISNHPFVDGNKRTAYVMMRLILKENKLDVSASENEKFDFVIKAASSELKYDDILSWILKNLK